MPVNRAQTHVSCSPALELALAEVGFQYFVGRARYDEDYAPDPASRATTNFANLARGADRVGNLKALFALINRRLNAMMAMIGYPLADYRIQLDIVGVSAAFGSGPRFLLAEMLEASVVNPASGETYTGAFGLNLSSYVRDYDFVLRLPELHQAGNPAAAMADFGRLHGLLYQLQFCSFWRGGVIDRPAVTAISVSSNRHYERTGDTHAILGERYRELPTPSSTTAYFAQMGLTPAFYLPPGNQAPLAIYLKHADPSSFTAMELVTLVAVMDAFQRIYRPEIYNRRERAGAVFHPSLTEPDYIRPDVFYDREERIHLAQQQAKRVREQFLEPYAVQLERMLRALDRPDAS